MTDLPPAEQPSLPPAAPQQPRPLGVGRAVLRAARHATASVLLLAFISPFALGAGVFAPGPLTAKATVVIPRGAGVADIAAKLRADGAVHLGVLFRLAARVAGPLRAGEYEIPARATPMDIALMMHEGKAVVRLFTVPEGLTSAEIVDLLKEETVLSGEVEAVPTEGSLLPESYRYSYGDSRASLIARMQKAMRDKINETWAAREGGLPIATPSEAVVLASIVEKETGIAGERARIAGVFYNRLRIHMRLQSDPTVIYALTGGKRDLDRSLTRDDLAFASPINTYASDGLPPQPICNPGVAALRAVMQPEHHNYLYFVADGTGGHAFAADLAAHNANVARWRQISAAGEKK